MLFSTPFFEILYFIPMNNKAKMNDQIEKKHKLDTKSKQIVLNYSSHLRLLK